MLATVMSLQPCAGLAAVTSVPLQLRASPARSLLLRLPRLTARLTAVLHWSGGKLPSLR